VNGIGPSIREKLPFGSLGFGLYTFLHLVGTKNSRRIPLGREEASGTGREGRRLGALASPLGLPGGGGRASPLLRDGKASNLFDRGRGPGRGCDWCGDGAGFGFDCHRGIRQVLQGDMRFGKGKGADRGRHERYWLYIEGKFFIEYGYRKRMSQRDYQCGVEQGYSSESP